MIDDLVVPEVLLNSYGAIHTGLGSEASWLWELAPFSHWLAWDHPKLGYGGMVTQDDLMVRSNNITDFLPYLEGAKALLCTERPLPSDLAKRAKEYGCNVYLLVNPEWLSGREEWLPYIDLFLAKTDACAAHLTTLGLPHARVDVPIDLARFPWRAKTKIRNVMFSNGWGGVHDRKGWNEVAKMLKLSPGLIKVYSQREIPIRDVGEVVNGPDMYADADLAVVPSRFEGVGLAVLEAMACGALVVATDAAPMSEFIKRAYGTHAERFLLPVHKVERVRVHDQAWWAHIVDPMEAVKKINELKQMSSEEVMYFSQMGRAYINTYHGIDAAYKIMDIMGC